MKFTDYKYEHMDIEALQAQLKAICSKLQSAASYDDFKNAFIELNDVNKYINTNQTLVDVRHIQWIQEMNIIQKKMTFLMKCFQY